MIPVENIADWRGQEVVDRTGDKLGKVEEGYFDGETDEPAFIAVKSGLVNKSVTLVPLGGASVGREYVRVDQAKSDVKKAPSFAPDSDFSLNDEARASRHFGLEYEPAGSGA